MSLQHTMLRGVRLLVVASIATACASSPATSVPSGSVEGSVTPSTSESTAPATPSQSPGRIDPGTIEVVSIYPEGTADYRNLESTSELFATTYPGSSAKLVVRGSNNTAIENRWRAGNPPEVNFGGWFKGTIPAAWEYAKAGQLYDLAPAMEGPASGFDGKWKDNILPGVLPFIEYPPNGAIYGAPREVTTIQFFYNKKIFGQLGLQIPTTWAEFLAIGDKLKAAGVVPLSLGGSYAPYLDYYFDYLLLRAAGHQPIVDALTGKSRFDEVGGVMQAADEFDKLVKGGYFQQGFVGTDFTAAQINFFSGKAAMILMGSWLQAEMKDSIPSDFELGTFPFPKLDGGAGDQDGVFGTVNSEVVAAQAPRPDLGAEWLRMQAAKVNQVQRTTELGYLSPYRGVSPPPGFEGIADRLNQGTALIDYEWGLDQGPQALRDAFQQPPIRLASGELSAAEMVKTISDGLAAAR